MQPACMNTYVPIVPITKESFDILNYLHDGDVNNFFFIFEDIAASATGTNE